MLMIKESSVQLLIWQPVMSVFGLPIINVVSIGTTQLIYEVHFFSSQI